MAATRDVILDASVQEFLARGEAGFRVMHVARMAGCATSVLYHHFGSREGLIDAALISIIREEEVIVREGVQARLMAATLAEDAIMILREYAKRTLGADQGADRKNRAQLVYGALTRPAVREAYQDLVEYIMRSNIEFVEVLKRKGMLRPELDSGAVALYLRVIDYGTVLNDVNDRARVDYNAWTDLIIDIAHAFLTDAPVNDSGSAPAELE